MRLTHFALLTTIFTSAALGQSARLEIFPGIAIYLHELFIFLWLIIHAHDLWELRTSPKLSYFSIYIVLQTILLSIFFHFPPFAPLLYLARFILYACFAFSLKKQYTKQKSKLILFPILSLALISLLGILQYIFLPDTRFLHFLGWDDHYLRLISTLFDPNFTGILLALGLLATQWQLTIATTRHKALYIALLPLFFFSLLLTYSRASFLSYLILSSSMAVITRSRQLLILTLLFLLSIFLLPRPASEGARLERTASIFSRTQSMQKSLQFPNSFTLLFGKGWYSNIKPERTEKGQTLPSRATAPDNSFLFLLSTTGILGFSLFIIMLRTAHVIFRPSPLALILFTAVCLHAFFNNTLFYPFILLYLPALMVGI